MKPSGERSKILILRLSALGDVVLCSAALSAIRRTRPDACVDWVVSTTWKSILEGDSRIRRLIAFDRSSGVRAWHRICRELFDSGYDEVLDLHASLRTRYARAYFAIRGLLSARSPGRWRVLSKARFRRIGFFIFKSLWPVSLRPAARGGLAVQAARIAGGTESDRPDLTSLLGAPLSPRLRESIHQLSGDARGFLTVMPGSAWPGKRWPVRRLAEVLQNVGTPVVILGTERDSECQELFELLKDAGIPSVRAFEAVTLPDTARLIHASRALLSNDTGLVHLAEAIGKPVVQIFGPTDPDLGFGAWRPESVAVGAPLWCRPCSKDGSTCFRPGRSRFLCLQRLTTAEVVRAVEAVLSGASSRSGSRPEGALEARGVSNPQGGGGP